MIELGLHTDNWRPLSLGHDAAIAKIVATGIKHIEFCAIHGQNFIAALGYDPGVSLQSNPRAIRRDLDKHGLEVSQIDGSYPMMGPNGSTFGVQYVQQTIRFAAELDCPMVDTVDGAFETPGMSRKEVFRLACDNYRQVLSWAEDYDIVVNIEPHGPYTNDIDFMQRLFKHFESEHLRCNFDTGNTFIAGHNPLEYLKALRKYVVHCHIKDVSPALAAALRGEETGIGSSEVSVGGGVNAENIRKCIELLHKTGWDGVVVHRVQRHGRKHAQERRMDAGVGEVSETQVMRTPNRTDEQPNSTQRPRRFSQRVAKEMCSLRPSAPTFASSALFGKPPAMDSNGRGRETSQIVLENHCHAASNHHHVMKTLSFILIIGFVCGFVVWVAEAQGKNSKLLHVVSFKFKEAATKEQIKEVEDAFRALKGKIPEIQTLEWAQTSARKSSTRASPIAGY